MNTWERINKHLFWHILSQSSCLMVKDQTSKLHKTKDKIIILYILFSIGDRSIKVSEQNDSKHTLYLLFS
jgi:hypothetical protein